MKHLTLQEAKNLRVNQIVYEIGAYNYDGTARRWRVNGKPKTWKRNPRRVKVPVKHGLWSYGYITENNLHFFTLTEPPRKPTSKLYLNKIGLPFGLPTEW
jgi:hypothetical protein